MSPEVIDDSSLKDPPTTSSDPGVDRVSDSPWLSLRHASFRSLWIATVASNLGTWMQDVGNAWLMTSITSSPLFVSLVQAATSLHMFLLALPAGALPDVVDRRRLLVAQLWMLAAAAGLAVLTAQGWSPRRCCWRWRQCSASVRHWPPRRGRRRCLNWSHEASCRRRCVQQHGGQHQRAGGPAVGGLVIAAAGPAAFGLNAVPFVGVTVVLLRWKRAHTPSTLPAECVPAALRTGTRYVLHADPLRGVLVRTAAFMFGASVLWTLIPVVARGEMALGPAGYGLLLGCLGDGAFVAVTVMPRVRRRFSSEAIVVAATVLLAVSAAALACIRRPLSLAPLLFLGGVGWVILLSSLNVAARQAVPAWVTHAHSRRTCSSGSGRSRSAASAGGAWPDG